MSSIIHTDPAPTLEEVWRLFRETDRLIKEQVEDAIDTRRMLREQAQEAERRSQEIERRLQEQRQESERRFQESERMFKEQIKNQNAKLGNLDRRLGEFVEGFVAPAAVRLFKERNINVHVISRNIEINNPELGLAMEIDLLVKNGDCCILIEVKSNLSINDVDEHLERMSKFKQLFPEYTQYKVYGAVTGMVIPQNVGRYAYRKGFFVIGLTGDAVKFLNDEKFNPAEW